MRVVVVVGHDLKTQGQLFLVKVNFTFFSIILFSHPKFPSGRVGSRAL